MAAILIITLACIILYRTGKASEMLEAFRIHEPATAPAIIQEAPQPKAEPQREPTPERLKLEAVAMNILLYNGVDTAPVRVKRLSDKELNNIIDLFMDDLL